MNTRWFTIDFCKIIPIMNRLNDWSAEDDFFLGMEMTIDISTRHCIGFQWYWVCLYCIGFVFHCIGLYGITIASHWMVVTLLRWWLCAWNSQYTMYNVHITVYNVRLTVYVIHCTVCINTMSYIYRINTHSKQININNK